MKLQFVRSFRGLQNFLMIPIMNPLAGFMMNGRWLKNRLHGKAAELCLANNGNNRVNT